MQLNILSHKLIIKLKTMKLLSNKVGAVITYGRVKIETRVGILEYSYKIGGEDDSNYQLESVLSNYHELTAEELDEIDDIITFEINK